MSSAQDQREKDAEVAAAKAEQILRQETLQRNLERALQNKADEDKEIMRAQAARDLDRINAEHARRVQAAEERLKQLQAQEKKNVEWTKNQNDPGKDK